MLKLMENKSKGNVPGEDFFIMCLLLQRYHHLITKYARYEIQVEEIDLICNSLCCIFYSRGWRRIYKIHCKIFQNHQRHQFVRSFMTNHYRKHFPLPGSVVWALLCPSIDPRLRLNRPPMRNLYSGILQFVWQGSRLKHYCWVWMY